MVAHARCTLFSKLSDEWRKSATDYNLLLRLANNINLNLQYFTPSFPLIPLVVPGRRGATARADIADFARSVARSPAEASSQHRHRSWGAVATRQRPNLYHRFEMGISERKQRERAALRLAILNATRELATEFGWNAVTLRRIAERIEYSAATVYEHFANKDAILAALAD